MTPASTCKGSPSLEEPCLGPTHRVPLLYFGQQLRMKHKLPARHGKGRQKKKMMRLIFPKLVARWYFQKASFLFLPCIKSTSFDVNAPSKDLGPQHGLCSARSLSSSRRRCIPPYLARGLFAFPEGRLKTEARTQRPAMCLAVSPGLVVCAFRALNSICGHP